MSYNDESSIARMTNGQGIPMSVITRLDSKPSSFNAKRDNPYSVWYAEVTYEDGAVIYYAFERAYEVKVSDFFDSEGLHEGITSILIR